MKALVVIGVVLAIVSALRDHPWQAGVAVGLAIAFVAGLTLADAAADGRTPARQGEQPPAPAEAVRSRQVTGIACDLFP